MGINFLIFVSGIIVGFLVAMLVIVVLVFFRRIVEQKAVVFENKISSLGPQPKGFIFIPPDDAEAARQEIIEKNRALGKDTKLSELI